MFGDHLSKVGAKLPLPFHSDLKPANYPAFLAGGPVPKPRAPNVTRAKHRRQMTRDLGQLRAQAVRPTVDQQRGATVACLSFTVNSMIFVTVRRNLYKEKDADQCHLSL